MHCRFFGLVGFLVLLLYSFVLAEERDPSLYVPATSSAQEKTFPGLLLPTPDLLGVTAQECNCTTQEEVNNKKPVSLMTGKTLASLSRPPTLALPAPIQNIAGPLLPKISPRDSSNTLTATAPGLLTQPPWQIQNNAPIPRVDQVWRITPVEALVQKYEGLTINSGSDLGLEVRAGSTKNDRATNAIKGIASTQVSLLPEINLPQRFRRFLSILGADGGRGAASPSPLRMVLATNGTYALNPNTKAVTSNGEVVGTLSWTTPMRERFTSDPWRFVAFRWQPSVSWESRSLLSTGQSTPTTRVPVSTLTSSLRGDLRLDFLSPNLVASGNYNYGQRLTVAPTTWEQASVSWKYQLNSQISLGGSLTHGMRGPSQPTERELKLEMGVTF